MDLLGEAQERITELLQLQVECACLVSWSTWLPFRNQLQPPKPFFRLSIASIL